MFNLRQFGERGELVNSFINNNPEDWWLRSNLLGHVVGSAFLLNPEKTHILLTHHKKLNKWLHLGGHCDIADPFETALREAVEESGIENISWLTRDVLDIDIHTIPANPKETEHTHYDIRYLFFTDMNNQFVMSEESNDLKWVELTEIEKYNDEVSFIRTINLIRSL